MKKIRQNCFETNSSSTHTLMLFKDPDLYYRWIKDSKVLFNWWEEDIITPEKIEEEVSNGKYESIKDAYTHYEDNDYYSWEDMPLGYESILVSDGIVVSVCGSDC